jgi:hypothetical protein
MPDRRIHGTVTGVSFDDSHIDTAGAAVAACCSRCASVGGTRICGEKRVWVVIVVPSFVLAFALVLEWVEAHLDRTLSGHATPQRGGPIGSGSVSVGCGTAHPEHGRYPW